MATLSFDSARYVGARIGIFDPSGRKVGRVSHLSNQELVVIAGDPALVRRVVEAAGGGATLDATKPANKPATKPAIQPTTVPVTGAASDAALDAVAPGLVDRLQQAT